MGTGTCLVSVCGFLNDTAYSGAATCTFIMWHYLCFLLIYISFSDKKKNYLYSTR